MKTPEELNSLKEEVETLNKKLAELTGEELEQVIGGQRNHLGRDRSDTAKFMSCPTCGKPFGWDYEYNVAKYEEHIAICAFDTKKL